MAVVAESLAKLLLHQRAWLRHYPPSSQSAAAQDAGAGRPVAPDSQQQQARLLQSALALLLQLQFHPATATLTEVCQRLSVFFDVFSAASEGNQLQLAAACLPAARQALHMKVKKHPAPLLAKYVLQLLQQARLRRARDESEGSNSRQGEQATCGTVVVCWPKGQVFWFLLYTCVCCCAASGPNVCVLLQVGANSTQYA
jgi:hypothetical protein